MKRFFILLFLLSSADLFSQPGTLDQSFGQLGVSLSPFITYYSYGKALAVQPDGKIVVAGYLDMNGLGDFRAFVTRYDSAGNFDPSFTNFITAAGGTTEYIRAMALQNDGKIVVAGHAGGTNSDFLLMRLTSSGAYDTAFGNSGIVITSFAANSTDETNAIAIQPDGKIVIAGWTSSNIKDFALLKFNTDGSIDSTFGVNGKVSTDINFTLEDARGIRLQPDGKILISGFTSGPVSAQDVAVLRYNANGSLDPTFGTNGIAVNAVNADDDAALSMVLQPDGKILLAGYVYTNFTYSDNLLMRLDSTGALDLSFNGNGIIISNPTNTDRNSTGVLLQSDGKIVITGRAFNSFNSDFSLTRFNSNGTIDPTFGNNGYAYSAIALEDDLILANAIQPDGKIVVTGTFTDSGLENFAVARYTNDSSLATTIKANYFQNDLLIYPQPASDYIKIRMSDNADYSLIAHIYSVTSSLHTSIITDKEISIKIADLTPGVYLIRIADASNKLVAAKKFVVE